MNQNSTTTPSANEVAVIKKIVNIFSIENLSYKEAISLLGHIKEALTEIALNDVVRKVNQDHL